MAANSPFLIYSSQSLGTAIKHYRSRAHISQAELAERAGINRSYLSGLEQGAETEYMRRLLRILRELGLRISLEEAD